MIASERLMCVNYLGTVEECVAQMMRSMRGRKRELVMTAGGKLAVWSSRLRRASSMPRSTAR